ncbi:MAG: hypothetical protein BWY31_04693 [Lentisphaerae bacterium ADurb.Bin242]|nr:MAG: hypothetical protein BWY31_04693 [Lentisphaerae bacterium ADurb.Bin242]
MVEDRPLEEFQLAPAGGAVLLDDLGPGDVRRHQVGRELDPREVQVQTLRQRADHQRLGQARHALQNGVPPREDARQQLLQHQFLPDDGLGHLLADRLVGRRQSFRRLDVVMVQFRHSRLLRWLAPRPPVEIRYGPQWSPVDLGSPAQIRREQRRREGAVVFRGDGIFGKRAVPLLQFFRCVQEKQKVVRQIIQIGQQAGGPFVQFRQVVAHIIGTAEQKIGASRSQPDFREELPQGGRNDSAYFKQAVFPVLRPGKLGNDHAQYTVRSQVVFQGNEKKGRVKPVCRKSSGLRRHQQNQVIIERTAGQKPERVRGIRQGQMRELVCQGKGAHAFDKRTRGRKKQHADRPFIRLKPGQHRNLPLEIILRRRRTRGTDAAEGRRNVEKTKEDGQQGRHEKNEKNPVKCFSPRGKKKKRNFQHEKKKCGTDEEERNTFRYCIGEKKEGDR